MDFLDSTYAYALTQTARQATDAQLAEYCRVANAVAVEDPTEVNEGVAAIFNTEAENRAEALEARCAIVAHEDNGEPIFAAEIREGGK